MWWQRKLKSERYLSATFDWIYAEAGRILEKHRPCGVFEGGRCHFRCNCCVPCQYLSPTGCTVVSLSCKLWLCHRAEKEFPECYQDLSSLREIAMQNNLLNDVPETKEDALKRILGTKPASRKLA